jgi:hypothetical protein
MGVELAEKTQSSKKAKAIIKLREEYLNGRSSTVSPSLV